MSFRYAVIAARWEDEAKRGEKGKRRRAFRSHLAQARASFWGANGPSERGVSPGAQGGPAGRSAPPPPPAARRGAAAARHARAGCDGRDEQR